MNHWSFVIGAYAVTLGATATLLAWAFLSMRRAEAGSDRVGDASE